MNKSTKQLPGIDEAASSYRKYVKHNVETALMLPDPDQELSSMWEPIEEAWHSQSDSSLFFPADQDKSYDLEEMVALFLPEIMQRSWFNAYRIAVGINQVVLDTIHQSMPSTGQYDGIIRQAPGFMQPILARVVKAVVSARGRWIETRRKMENLVTWQRKWALWLNELAGAVVGIDPIDQLRANRLVADGGTLTAYIPYFPASLRGKAVQISHPCVGWSHNPDDLSRMMDEFSFHWSERSKPLTVMSVCAPGSYLAPLYASILISLGYLDVRVLTLEVGQPLTHFERAVLREVTDKNGLVLLCDDPPVSGRRLTQTAQVLDSFGLPPQNTLQLMQLFGDYSSFAEPRRPVLVGGMPDEPVYADLDHRRTIRKIGRTNVNQ